MDGERDKKGRRVRVQEERTRRFVTTTVGRSGVDSRHGVLEETALRSRAPSELVSRAKTAN